MKRLTKMAGMALLISASAAHAQHAGHGDQASKGPSAPQWTSQPYLQSAERFSRSGAKYLAFNMHAMEGTAWASYDGQGEEALNSASQGLTPDETGLISFKSLGSGGYYLVRIMGHGPNGETTTASTVKYFSNPGPDPRDLLNAARTGFEITPNPLPREHSHYRENETWTFQVRKDGLPMADKTVVMETSNGTKTEFTTDTNGVAHVMFPGDAQDVPKEQWNHGQPPSSSFVLAVRDGGLLATYNDTYNRDALAGKSVWAGIGFTVLGMAAAFPFIRRRKSNKGE